MRKKMINKLYVLCIGGLYPGTQAYPVPRGPTRVHVHRKKLGGSEISEY